MADGSVKIDITADDSDIKKKLNGVGDDAEDAAGGLDDLGDSAGNVGKEFGTADVAIGSFVGNALSNLASKLVETVGNIIALADETREYREDMAKLDTAFTTAGHSTETAQKAYDSFYKILGESDRSVEAVNHLAELTKNEEDVAKWSTIAAGVTAKFGDSLPLEGLTEAANETAKVGQTTGVLADALNWASADSTVFAEALGGNNKAMKAFNQALKNGENVEDAFSAALGKMSTEEERSAAITNTLNGLYSEAAAEYNELTAGAQAARDATNNMEQAQARLGEAIEPVTTAWTNFKAGALQWVLDNWNVVAVALAGITTALVLLNAATIAQTVSQWAQNAAFLASPITWVVAGITALVAGFLYLWNNCEGFRNFWIGLWDSIKAVLSPVIEWLKQAFAQAWAAIKAVWDKVKPYFEAIWEVIKLRAMIAWELIKGYFSIAWEAIKLVWNNAKAYFTMVWENIKLVFSVVKVWFAGMFLSAWEAIKVIWNAVTGYFKQIWETIKGIFAVVKAVLSGNWSEAWEAIKGIVSGWGQYFAGVWDGIKGVFATVKVWFSSTFSAAWEAIKGIFANVKTYFSTVVNNIVSAFSNIKEKFLTIGSNIVAGIKQGISNAWNNLKAWLEGLFGDLIGVAKRILGIHSPSRVFKYIGEMITKGLAVGIEQGTNAVVKAEENIFDKMKSIIEDAEAENVETVKGFMNERKQIDKKYNDDLWESNYQHSLELQKLTEDTEKKLTEAKKKKGEERNKAIAEINKDFAEKEAELVDKHNKELISLEENYNKDIQVVFGKTQDLIRSKMTALVTLNEDYKNNVEQIQKELNDNIAELWKNYDNQLASRTESIANSLNLWQHAEKNAVSGKDLTRNLISQINVLEDYNEAIATLEGRGISGAFLEELKGLGVAAAGEIEALSKMSDDALKQYVELWGEKQELAKTAAIEELEPLKDETLLKITELTEGASTKLTELRTEYQEQSLQLMADLKQSMIDTGDAGYNELILQVDDYMGAGSDLMGGVIEGILNKAPEVINAVSSTVRTAINAAKKAAGIASPSKVMEQEVGANLAEGVAVGWADKIDRLRGKMAAEMQGITARIQATVNAENARMAQGVGVRDTGFAEVAQAVGMQTAGINSLASEYRRGSSAQVTVPLILDGRELGRAIVDLGNAETVRTGTSLVMA